MSARANKMLTLVSEEWPYESGTRNDNLVMRGTSRVTWGENEFLRDDGTGTHSNYDIAYSGTKLFAISSKVAQKRPTKGLLKTRRPLRLATFFHPKNDDGKANKRNLNAAIAINANLQLELESLQVEMKALEMAQIKSDSETALLLDKAESTTGGDKHDQNEAWLSLRTKFPTEKTASIVMFTSEANTVDEMESEFAFPTFGNNDTSLSDLESDYM